MYMRKKIIISTIALLIIAAVAGCGHNLPSDDTSEAPSFEEGADDTGISVPTPTPYPEIPYIQYSDDLFAPTIEAPDDIVTELPDASNDADLMLINGVYFHKDLPRSIRNTFFKYFEMEPPEVRMAMDAYGVVIIVDKNGLYTGGHAGLYYAEDNILAINGSDPGKIAMSVNHEIGHCVDSMIGELVDIPIDDEIYWLGISNSDEFVSIYEEEVGESGYPSWNSNGSFEFFAETYRYVIEDNTYMMERAPKAAEYVQKVLRQYYRVDSEEPPTP